MTINICSAVQITFIPNASWKKCLVFLEFSILELQIRDLWVCTCFIPILPVIHWIHRGQVNWMTELALSIPEPMSCTCAHCQHVSSWNTVAQSVPLVPPFMWLCLAPLYYHGLCSHCLAPIHYHRLSARPALLPSTSAGSLLSFSE